MNALYWEFRSGNHKQQKEPAKYTWDKLIEAWRTDKRLQRSWAESTKWSYRRDLDRILERNADKDVRRTTRQAVLAAHDKLSDTPRQADKYLQVIRLLWNHGQKEQDWPLGENPAARIRMYGRLRKCLLRPEWLIEKLKERGYDAVEKAFCTWRNGLGEKSFCMVFGSWRLFASQRLAAVTLKFKP